MGATKKPAFRKLPIKRAMDSFRVDKDHSKLVRIGLKQKLIYKSAGQNMISRSNSQKAAV